jgi:hypothetical protein
VALAVGAAYVLFFVRLTSFPLQDYPNHIARAVIMADLLFHHGARFGQEFATQLMLAPYILGDLILAASVAVFGPVTGAGIFTALVLLCLPGALLFYMSVNKLAPQARLLVFLLGLYLSTDWFFLMGFMAFRMSIAALVITLALADLLRRSWSIPMFCLYIGVLLLSYTVHLAWLAFFGVILGVSGFARWWFRTSSLQRELWLMLPVLALVLWHFVFLPQQGAGMPAMYQPEWGGALKVTSLLTEFRGFGGLLAQPLTVMFGLSVFWPIRNVLRGRTWRKPEVLEQLAIVVVFLAIYVALPRELEHTAFIDLRALPIVALFLVFAALRMPSDARAGMDFGTKPVLLLAMLLVMGNLAYLARHLGPENEWMARYRTVVKSIPVSARVLSIYTANPSNSMPFLHAQSFVPLDRGGITPYLFAGDRGEPMLYFRYKHRPYRPAEDWYAAERVRAVLASAKAVGSQVTEVSGLRLGKSRWYESVLAPDWRRVACDYDYLLVTVPFEPQMIGVPTRMIASNGSARTAVPHCCKSTERRCSAQGAWAACGKVIRRRFRMLEPRPRLARAP